MHDKAGAVTKAPADHSGFIEHLRLIHFTLCLSCFIAVIAVSAKSPSSAQRAYDQSNFLLRLQTKWDGGKWLDEIANKNRIQNHGFEATVEVVSAPSQTFIFKPPVFYLWGQWRYAWFAFAKKEKGGLTTLKSHDGAAFTNIEDAEAIWNVLGDFKYMVTPSKVNDGWMITGGSEVDAKLNGGIPAAISSISAFGYGPKTDASWFVESDAEIEANAIFYREPSKSVVRELIGKHKAQCYFSTWLENGRSLLFPDDCKIERIDLQKLLGDSILPPEFPFGDFNQSFPDASDLGKSLKTLRLSELRDYFQAERARTDDKIELPLVKLPAESIAYWVQQ